jgi:hypothetical protein
MSAPLAPAGKQPVITTKLLFADPRCDRTARLLGYLELHRPAGLALEDHCSAANTITGCYVGYLQTDQVTASQLAVQSKVEERQIPKPLLYLETYADAPDLNWLQRAFRSRSSRTSPKAAWQRN